MIQVLMVHFGFWPLLNLSDNIIINYVSLICFPILTLLDHFSNSELFVWLYRKLANTNTLFKFKNSWCVRLTNLSLTPHIMREKNNFGPAPASDQKYPIDIFVLKNHLTRTCIEILYESSYTNAAFSFLNFWSQICHHLNSKVKLSF